MNLVSRKDIAKLEEHHLAPSSLFIVLQRLLAGERILDIGSGGGFPGIVCAILQPASEFVLVDSTRKKTDFLQSVVTTLNLPNVTVLWQRVEDLAAEPHWQHYFDRSISRAVAPLTDLVRWSQPLVKRGGTVEALKGQAAAAREMVEFGQHATWHLPPKEWLSNDHISGVAIVTVELA